MNIFFVRKSSYREANKNNKKRDCKTWFIKSVVVDVPDKYHLKILFFFSSLNSFFFYCSLISYIKLKMFCSFVSVCLFCCCWLSEQQKLSTKWILYLCRVGQKYVSAFSFSFSEMEGVPFDRSTRTETKTQLYHVRFIYHAIMFAMLVGKSRLNLTRKKYTFPTLDEDGQRQSLIDPHQTNWK